MKDRKDLKRCGCGGATFPGPMVHHLGSGKSPDA